MTDITERQPAEATPDEVTRPCELTIVLPCLNEAETLQVCVEKAIGSLRRLGIDGEVIVADNGSTDGSLEIAADAGARVVNVPRRGYGAALQGGIEAAKGEYVLMADADDSYALDDIGAFVDALRNGADLVMGNRFQGGIAPGAMPWLHRYVGNPVLSLLGRVFFKIPVHDFHCGMRAFRADRARELNIRTTGMEFASELVVRFALAKAEIVEVPTTLRPDGRSRAPHLRTWRDGWRHLRFLLALSPRWFLLYPSLALFVVGAVGLVWLATGPHSIGGISLGIHTMLACATGVIVALQGMGMALVARSFAAHINLLPPSAGTSRMLERLTLERGLVVGALAILLGIAGFVAAFVQWGERGFGQLDAVSTMRLPIIGMVFIVAGLQVILISFATSLVDMETR